MKLRNIPLCLVLLSSQFAFSQTQQGEPLAQSQQTQLTDEQWRDSLNMLRRQIEQQPYSSDLHLRKAAVNIELGQWEYAADEYSLVLQKEPDNLAALYYRAYVNSHLRRYDLALRDYERFLSLSPYHLEGRLGLIHILERQNKQREALDHANTLVELYPDSAMVYAVRADIETRLKAYDTALLDWNDAVRLAPTNADYQLSRIDILLRLKRKTDAKTALDALVSQGTPQGILREWYEKCK